MDADLIFDFDAPPCEEALGDEEEWPIEALIGRDAREGFPSSWM